MRIDFYTKAVLTIIAGCLVYLCLGKSGISTTTYAQAGVNRVILVGWEDWKGTSHSLSQGDYSSGVPVFEVAAPK